MTLGETLKQARIEQGWSIRQLAEIVGISHTAICNYENGKFEPRISHLKWLAEALLLPITELIERI
jgi:transcriptional regulator with XRE-family HTH domain